MPLYEYACPTCDIRFDRMRPMTQADQPAECPQCGRPAERCASLFAARGSDGRTLAGSSGGSCAGCTGGSCASCGH